MRKILVLTLTIAMIFMLSIGVLWAIADYDDEITIADEILVSETEETSFEVELDLLTSFSPDFPQRTIERDLIAPERADAILNGAFASLDEVMQVMDFIRMNERSNGNERDVRSSNEISMSEIYIPENIENLINNRILTIDDLNENLNIIMPMAIMATSASAATLSYSTPINQVFPDPVLQREIARTFTGGNVYARISQIQLDSIFGIFICNLSNSESRVRSIEGMQFLSNITSFWAGNHDISDLSPLSGLANNWWSSLELDGNRIYDISPIEHLIRLSGASIGIWEQRVTKQIFRSAAQNIIRNEHGDLISPILNSISPGGSYNNGWFSWNLQENQHASYRWTHIIMSQGWPSGMFSGTVTVEIINIPSTTLYPAANLFVRHDRGLQPQNAESYRNQNANGLIWHSPNQGNQLVIGMDHASTNQEGAHRETFVRFDLPIDPVERAAMIYSIMNVSGVGDDKITFNLFITHAHGTAVQRHIDLHLLPAEKAGFVNTMYPSRANPRQLGAWMSAYDAFRVGITAREHFRYNIVRPDAQSDRIYNPSQVSSMIVDGFVNFDLTEPLQRYFRENPNARSFAFVLSNLRGNGLMIALAHRNSTPMNQRPYLSIPGAASPPTVPVSIVDPTVDLFIRSDLGVNAQTRAEIVSSGHGTAPQPENADLVIGQNHIATNLNGAYRETFMRFNLSMAEIDGIINASGRGNDRAVLSLFVTTPPNPSAFGTAQSRAINVRVVPDNAIRRGMSSLNAFDAGITAREHFRTNPDAVSEHMFLNGAGEVYTRLNRFFEIDLTAALQRYFRENSNARSFGIVLYNLDGNALIVAASTRQTPANASRRPTLTVPLGEGGAAGSEKEFLITVNGNEFYSNMASGGRLYKNGDPIYENAATWLALAGNYIYFRSSGLTVYTDEIGIFPNRLKRWNLSENRVEAIRTKCNPFYIVTDGNDIFYANWNNGGRIYRHSPNGSSVLKVDEVGINLRIEGSYLIFENALKRRKIHNVTI